jgi:hypothetical protein
MARTPVCVLIATAMLTLLGVTGCHTAYEMPSLSEPHATAKIRIAYHHSPGTNLEHLVLLNGHSLPVPLPPIVPGEVSRGIPIRLEPAQYEVRAGFFHLVTVMQTHTETYSCGPNATCTRMVTTPVLTRVYDENCPRATSFAPQRDAVYLLQYDYFGSDRCTLACLREWPQPDGSFRNAPCEPAPAAH